MGPFFYCSNEKSTIQILLQQTKEITTLIRDRGIMQRTPLPSVRIGHMLNDLASARPGIPRAVPGQTSRETEILIS